MKRKLISIGAVVIVLALLLTLAPSCGKEKGEVKTLKIGFMGALSGPAASWGTQHEQGAKWAIDKINEEGGIEVGDDTYMLELVSCDTQFTGSVAATCGTRLVYDEGIHYVVGPITPAGVEALKPLFRENKVFNVCMSASSEPSPEDPYHFNGITVTANGAWEDGHYALFTELFPEAKTVAHIDPTAYADPWFSVAKAAAEKYGMTVVEQKGYELGITDFYPILAPVVTKNPDAIDMLASPPGDMALMIKQARELGYEGILMAPNAAPMDLLIEITGLAYAEGYLMNQPDYLSPLLPEETHELYEDFLERFPEAVGGMQNTTISGYATVMLYKQGIERADSIDTEKVRAVFDDPNFKMEFPGLGERKLMGCQTYGICRNFPWFSLISEVRQGELVTLAWKWHDVP